MLSLELSLKTKLALMLLIVLKINLEASRVLSGILQTGQSWIYKDKADWDQLLYSVLNIKE